MKNSSRDIINNNRFDEKEGIPLETTYIALHRPHSTSTSIKSVQRHDIVVVVARNKKKADTNWQRSNSASSRSPRTRYNIAHTIQQKLN